MSSFLSSNWEGGVGPDVARTLCTKRGAPNGFGLHTGGIPWSPWDQITRHLTSECWHRMVREAVTKTLTRLWVGVILIAALPGERLMGIFIQ